MVNVKRQYIIDALDRCEAKMASIGLEESIAGIASGAKIVASGSWNIVKGVYAYFFTSTAKLGRKLTALDRAIAMGKGAGRNVDALVRTRACLNFGVNSGLWITLPSTLGAIWGWGKSKYNSIMGIPEALPEQLPSAEDIESLSGKGGDSRFEKVYANASSKYEDFKSSLMASSAFGVAGIIGGFIAGLMLMAAGLVVYNKQTGKALPASVGQAFSNAIKALSSGNISDAVLEPVKLVKDIANSSPACFLLILLGATVMMMAGVYGVFKLLESSQEQ